ncbi:hypothetical protein GOEFS_077_00220 [Gordonia effusa NBRC 100432]|uniref:Uncharacterized protein n=1 Tax=Gordonia effusa NBRC 100432 TaxID=1077974 RepID=H0R2C9_9ACTN|nr:hypothetical protein GOEFS_077_00220 [Gordonia effusa NBRC 100432]
MGFAPASLNPSSATVGYSKGLTQGKHSHTSPNYLMDKSLHSFVSNMIIPSVIEILWLTAFSQTGRMRG